jgi:Uma2 family endonuclease
MSALPMPVDSRQPTGQAPDVESLYEVVDGQRVELAPMSYYAVRIASRLNYHLNAFGLQHGLGEAVVDNLFRLPLPVERNRRPDVAFVSAKRWPRGQRGSKTDNVWDVVPDIAAEVVSPTDYAEEVLEKVEEYLRAGVQLVWVFYPQRAVVHVFESMTAIKGLRPPDALDGGSVLPGFSLPLTELFLEEGPPS